MKLVLSRKGFDSTAGGGASPVLADGRMVSLPIPEPIDPPHGVRYAELSDADGTNYLDLLGRLGYDRYDATSTAHLDPDLVPSVRPRSEGWRGMLGQVDAAASHLANQGVGPGDLFLFWGRFAPVDGSGRTLRALPAHHALFGYLEVGTVVDAGRGEAVGAAPDHPHFAPAYRGRSNLVYVATERLSHDPSCPGWGVFRWAPPLVLTAPGSRGLSTWRVPECLHASAGTRLTYHLRPELWSPPDGSGFVTLARRGRGQEFVCEATPAVLDWALGVVLGTDRWSPDGTGVG